MDVAERVHLIPVGYENDRIVLPAVRLRADRVVLLRYEDETDHPSYVETVRERFVEEGIDHETVPCNIFDFYDSIGTVAELSTRFADHEVYVNLASGSKVTAIGGMIACMTSGATPYYVRAKRYAGRNGRRRGRGYSRDDRVADLSRAESRTAARRRHGLSRP